MKLRTTRPSSLKFILAYLLVILLSVPAVCFALPDGDVDGNGRVTGADALLILRAYVGLDPVTPRIAAHGIITRIGPDNRPHPGGSLSLIDPLLVLQKAIGLINWDFSDPGQVNQAPVASAGSNQTVTLQSGQTAANVTLNGSGSDADGVIASYLWSGTPQPTAVASPSITLGAGTHTFTLVVTDNQGVQSSASTVTITVKPAVPGNQAPIANAGINQTITLPQGQTTTSVTLNGSATDADGTITGYLWSGTPKPADVAGPSVTLGVGTYTFTLTATDNLGAQSTASSVTVTVNAAPPVNQAPIANAGNSQSANLAQGQSTTTVNLHGSATDSDGTITGYTWSGSPKPADVANPNVLLGVGVYTFTLIVTDDKGLRSLPATVTITVNPAPIPAPVILTRSLPAGRVGSPYIGSINARDPGGASISFALDQAPIGMAINASSGTLAWQPVAGDVGSAQIVVSVTNTSGGIDRRTFTIAVPDTIAPTVNLLSPPLQVLQGSTTVISAAAGDNKAIKSVSFLVDGVQQTVATSLPYQFNLAATQAAGTVLAVQAVAEDTSGNTSASEARISVFVEKANNRAPLLGALAASYTVAEGSSLTIPVSGSDPDGDTVVISAATLPTSVPHSSFNAASGNGAFTFSPDYSQAGSYSVTFRAVDPSGMTDQKTAEITVSNFNRPATITTESLPNARVDYPYNTTIVASDPDGDPLAFNLVQGPTGMTINSMSGAVTWRPAISTIGSHTVTVAVSDGKGGSDTRQFTLQVPDSIPPSIFLSAPKEAIPGASFTVVATATDNVGVSLVTIAVTGQTSVDLTTAPYEHPVTLPGALPAGATVTITATAKDADGNSSSSSVKIKIVAAPDIVNPTVTLTAPAAVTAGSTVTLGAVATDDQGIARLDFSVDGSAIGSAGPATPTIKYQVPANTATAAIIKFSVTATDFSGNSTTAQAQSTVVEIPDMTPPVINLSVPATIAVGSTLPITLSAADDRGIASVELLVAHNRVAYFTSAVSQTVNLPLPTGVLAGMELVVELIAVDQAGNPTSASTTASVIARGQGILTGAVYDDATGQPLADAAVNLVLNGQSEQSSRTDSRGRYSFVADEGNGGLTVTKAGYSRVDRYPAVIFASSGRRIADARLTPVPVAGSTLSAVLGGSITVPFTSERGGFPSAIKESGVQALPSGTLTVSVPAGALNNDRILTLVQVGAQGLQGALPAGWSPVAAFDLMPHGVSFAAPVIAEVPSLFGSVASADIVVARWDESSHSWLAAGIATVSGKGANLGITLPVTGQYAFLVRDTGSSAPAVPASGTPLSAAPLFPLGQELQAQVTPQPKLIHYKPGVRSTVGSRVAAATPLTSGTSVWASIAEDYSFYSGDRIVAEPYTQDIVLYTFGLPTGALLADYPVVPGVNFNDQLLEKGIISVTTSVPPANADVVTVVPPGGGVVTAAGSEALIFPVDSVSRTVPVVTRQFNLTESGLTLPAGFTLLGGVTFTLPGAVLQLPAELTIPVPADFIPGGDLLLVRPVVIGGATHVAVIGRGIINSGRIISTREVPGSATALFPGITAEGSVFFLQTAANPGYAGGTVSGTGRLPFSGALVSSDTLPLVAVSGGNGGYVTVVTPGAFTLTALDTVKMDKAAATGNVMAAAFAPLDLSLAIEAPTVVSVAPANNAINVALTDPVVITLSEPVVVAEAVNIQVTSGAAGATTIVNGSVELSVDGTTITFRHPDLFSSNTLYTVTVSGLVDRSATAMSAPFTSTFTSLNTDPPVAPPAANISATIPGSDGITTVAATQGSAGLHDTVYVVNLTTGSRTPVLVDQNGGFSVVVPAGISDQLQIAITGPGGGTTTVLLEGFRQKSPDGSILAAIGPKGGRVAGQNGIILDVSPNSFPKGAIVRLKVLSEEELGLKAIAEFPFIAGFEIESSAEPEVYLNVSAPMAEGTDPRTNGLVVKIVDVLGTPARAIVDTAKMINGRLATSSPPCQGIIDRVGRYALLLNDDQRMRYQSVLTTVYPPDYTGSDLIITPYLNADGSSSVLSRFFDFILNVTERSSRAGETLCLPVPPNHQATIVFQDARNGEVLRSIPVDNTSAGGNVLNITYVDSTDTQAPDVVELNPPGKVLSLSVRSLELRFSEPVSERSILDTVKIIDARDYDRFRSDSSLTFPFNVKVSENGTLATITPKQLLPMGTRFFLITDSITDLVGNTMNLSRIEFFTSKPKMIYPTDTSRLDRNKVAADLNLSAGSIGGVAFSDVDFSTMSAKKSSDNKWHTSLLGLNGSFGTLPYRLFSIDAADPTSPTVLSGVPSGNKYAQKIQFVKDAVFKTRSSDTSAWQNRKFFTLVRDPSSRLCADPSTTGGAALLADWRTRNGCSNNESGCTETVIDGCGDLAVATGYDSVYSLLWLYDVTDFANPLWLTGSRLLSDYGELKGYPPKKWAPAGSGFAKRFDLLSPLNIQHGSITNNGTMGAYIAVPGIGLELVDVGANIPDINDFTERGINGGTPLTRAEKLTVNPGSYYQDVRLLNGTVLAIAGDRSDGTGISTLERFGTDLSGPTSGIALPNIPNRFTVVEDFLSYDDNGDGITEPHDYAFITGFNGGISIVEIPRANRSNQVLNLVGFLKTPAGYITKHIEVDHVDKVAYVGARYFDNGVQVDTLLVADVSRIGANVTAEVDSAGWDKRIIGKFTVKPPGSTSSVSLNGFRLDRQRGLLYAAIDSGVDGDGLAVFRIAECADIGLDFSSPGEAAAVPAEIEKRALQATIAKGLTKAQADAAAGGCGPDSLQNMTMLEQGSGACIWTARGCQTNYQPGISDHDYELFFPISTPDSTRLCVSKALSAQFRNSTTKDLIPIDVEGYRLTFPDITFFTMPREEFETALLNVNPPSDETSGDAIGDMGLGRQMLLLKWLLEGAYVDIPGRSLQGKPLLDILALLRSSGGGEPSRIKRLEGYEWAKLQESELFSSGALIRLVGDSVPGTTLNHALDKDLHKIGKAGIRAVMARMVANTKANILLVSNANGNIHSNEGLACLDASFSINTREWREERCDSFEHFVASMAARITRDTSVSLFTPTQIRDVVYPFYRVKSGKEHLDSEQKANTFISNAYKFIKEVGREAVQADAQTEAQAEGEAKRVYDLTIGSDIYAAQRRLNLILAISRAVTARSNGKKQIIPRLFNTGGKSSEESSIVMYVPAQSTKETVTVIAGESRLLDTKKVPDTRDTSGATMIEKKTFVLDNINQADTNAGNKWLSFLIDVPEKRTEEPYRKNNWAKVHYYVLDPASPTVPQPAAATLPVPDTNNNLLNPDNVCLNKKASLTITQTFNGEIVEHPYVYAGATTCARIGLIVTNTSGQALRDVVIYNNYTHEAFPTIATLANGAINEELFFNYCPGSTVKTESLFQSASVSDSDGNPVPLDSIAPSLTIETLCPIVIEPLEQKPNPEVSQVMVGGTFYRYYRVMDYRTDPPKPLGNADVKAEFIGPSLINKNYTTNEAGYVILPFSAAPLKEMGMAVPWDTWNEAVLTTSTPIQSKLSVNINGTCSVPRQFTVNRKPIEVRQSLKAVAGGSVAVTDGAKFSLGGQRSLDIAWLGQGNGETETFSKLTFGRSASWNAGIGAGTATKFKMYAGGSVGVAKPGVNIGASLAVTVGDKYAFPLPLDNDNKLKMAGLLLDTVVEAGAGNMGPVGFVYGKVLEFLNDQVTSFNKNKVATSLGMAADVSGSVSIGKLNFNIARMAVSPAIEADAGGVAKVGFNIIVEDQIEKKSVASSIGLTGELGINTNVKAGLAQRSYNIPLTDEPPMSDYVAWAERLLDNEKLSFLKNLDKLVVGDVSMSEGASFSFVQKVDENYRPAQLELTLQGKRNFGLKLVGNTVLDLGPGYQTNMSITVTDPIEIAKIIQELSIIYTLADTTSTYMQAVLPAAPAANLVVGPLMVLYEAAKVISLSSNAQFAVRKEAGDGVTFPIGITAEFGGMGGDLKFTLSANYANSISESTGVIKGGIPFTLEDYASVTLATPTLAEATGRIGDFMSIGTSIQSAFHGVTFDSQYRIIKSFGSAELRVQNDADFSLLKGIAAFDFTSISGPMSPYHYSVFDVTGSADKPHYGIGGFQHFLSSATQLSAPATLILNYHDNEVAGLDVSTLGLYTFTEDSGEWNPVNGVHDPVQKTFTAQVTKLGLYTIAPPMPTGTITWALDQVERLNVNTADEKTRATFSALPPLQNNGTPVPPGTIYHVLSAAPYSFDVNGAIPYGTITSSDQQPAVSGTQLVIANDGKIHLVVEFPGKAELTRIIAFTDVGTAFADQLIPLVP
ncbi:MAG: PKD domain-containing protein [Desulfuromonadaceae bacterium]